VPDVAVVLTTESGRSGNGRSVQIVGQSPQHSRWAACRQGADGEAIMASLRIWMSCAFVTWIVLVATPSLCLAQAPPSPAAGLGLDPASMGTNTALVGPWEFTLAGRIGVPAGRLKVGDFPPSGGGATPGTLLRRFR
jgi:hypothetical protein